MNFAELNELGRDGIEKQFKSPEIKSMLEELLAYEPESIPNKKSERVDLLWSEVETLRQMEEQNNGEQNCKTTEDGPPIPTDSIRRDKTTQVSTGIVPLVHEIFGEIEIDPYGAEFNNIKQDLDDLYDGDFTYELYKEKLADWKESGESALDFDNKALNIVLKNNFAYITQKKEKKPKKASFTTLVRAIVRKFIIDNNEKINSNDDLWKLRYLSAETITPATEEKVVEALAKIL